MSKKLYLLVGVMLLACFFVVNALYAGTKVSDVIKMENKAYKKHTKPIVDFSHKKHNEDYKIDCGECHHDKNNKPLKNLKAGDNVQECMECHKKEGYVTGKAAKDLSDKQKLEYHANAMHDNCTECHKKHNKEKKLKKDDKGYAPATCVTCHAK
ncbi:MAG: cytochrome c3 family protein [Desulfobacterales bacterium]|nr:cytochrome c3 family protein [Desulfobacterales bacterium]